MTRYYQDSPLFFIAAISMSLYGCSVGPDHATPAASVPTRFIEEQRPADAVRSENLLTLVDWWKRFEDPTLNLFIAKALSDNLTLEQAKARISQARGSATAAGASLLPEAGLGTSAIRRRFSGGGLIPRSGTFSLRRDL